MVEDSKFQPVSNHPTPHPLTSLRSATLRESGGQENPSAPSLRELSSASETEGVLPVQWREIPNFIPLPFIPRRIPRFRGGRENARSESDRRSICPLYPLNS